MRRVAALALAFGVLAAACTSALGPDALRIGAVYPLSGSQGPGGVDEFHGVQVAADLVNRDGGVDGRPVRLVPVDVPGADAAPGAIARLDREGIDIVIGSYGSTISAPASAAAARRGMVFWESGAVGEMSGEGAGSLVFRVAPNGSVLGRNAIDFVADRYAPVLGVDPSDLRFAVTLVDDAYGHGVAQGALDEIAARGYTLATTIAYDPNHVNMPKVVRELAASRPDVLFVSGYVADSVAMRREIVRQGLHLLAGIGTSSSYCMPRFGAALGSEAVGLFASDKPDADVLNPDALTPQGRALFRRAEAAYEARFDQPMSEAALAGFSAAWALLAQVLPAADGPTPTAVADAANAIRLPPGSLPNGSGLQFGGPGTGTAGGNLLALGVIEQWTAPEQRVVVWPAAYATAPLERIDPLP
jgi:branched-chain amino acid transport system substrate-binding protein